MKNVGGYIIKFMCFSQENCKFLDLSAKSETSSITISLSRFVFSPKPLFTVSFRSIEYASVTGAAAGFERALKISNKPFNLYNSFGQWNST